MLLNPLMGAGNGVKTPAVFTPPRPRFSTPHRRAAAALAALLLGTVLPSKAVANAAATVAGPRAGAQEAGTDRKKTPARPAEQPTKNRSAAQGAAKPAKPAAARGSKAAAVGGPAWGTPEVVRDFAADVGLRNAVPTDWLLRQLSQARHVQRVRELIMPPPTGTAKNWAAYRARFIEPERIAAGVAFWNSAEPWLTQAEKRWGVPAEIVVGIIGVETFYGRVMGNFRVIDALATLAFDFPPGRRDRSRFFRDELEALLLASYREKWAPHSLMGSFAGATGLPQFMPSSRTRWALDMDGDGRIDLHTSKADVVGSVAHYLASFGWQQGMPTHHAVTPPPPGPDRTALLAPDILPSFSAEQMLQRGAVLDAAGRTHVGPMALVELENGDAPPSYVAGTQNFYTVTRYNWSSYYAMAVIDLAEAVARARAGSR